MRPISTGGALSVQTEGMELKSTRYSVADGIATITLYRPDRMNAWTGRMHTEYRYSLEQAEADASVRVIIVTGEGRAFCAGADMQALEGHAAKGGYDSGTRDDIPKPGFGVRPEFDQNFAYHFGLTKPVIAAMNGAAAGVGLVLACFADIRFAVPGAKLTTAHGRFNMPAEYGLSWLLPRIVGLARANDLLMSSRVFLTDEAHDMGLINRLVAREDLMAEVTAYARKLADGVAPHSLAATKRQIYVDQHRDVGSSVAEADRLLDEMVAEPDYKEAVRAWMGKRKADWKWPNK